MSAKRFKYPPGISYRSVASGHIVWGGTSLCGSAFVDDGIETGVTCYECRKRWANAGRIARGKEPLA